MIEVLRLTIGTNLVYHKAQILGNTKLVPNFFENANFVFKCRDGIRSSPYYNISIIELDAIQRKVPDGIKATRISVSFDLTYENVVIIPNKLYDKYDIPLILPQYDQLVFTNKEGTYITSDYQVNFIHFTGRER